MNQRFTPAYAGKIESIKTGALNPKVHPRIRGEDSVTFVTVSGWVGSPPHTRGRLRGVHDGRVLAGFTPAYAGKIVVSIRLF